MLGHPAAGARHGRAGGFSMRLQDRAGMAPDSLAQAANDFIAPANADARHPQRLHHLPTATPQLYVDVDRDKAQMLSVPLDSIFEALRVYLGSAYVNDFNMFGRTYRVTAQADGAIPPGARERRRASACATRTARWCRWATS